MSSRSPTAISWATASILPRGSRASAKPGGICLSEDAWRQVRDKVPETFADLGEKRLKNIARPMRVFARAGAASGRPPIPAPGPPAPALAQHAERPVRTLLGAVTGLLENVGSLVEAYAGGAESKKRRVTRNADDSASGQAEKRRNRGLRRVIIAAAILSALAGRACTDRHSVAPPASPQREGALDGGFDGSIGQSCDQRGLGRILSASWRKAA